MKFPRSALSVAVVEGSLFALGGYDGADFLASVEFYNFEKVFSLSLRAVSVPFGF